MKKTKPLRQTVKEFTLMFAVFFPVFLVMGIGINMQNIQLNIMGQEVRMFMEWKDIATIMLMFFVCFSIMEVHERIKMRRAK